MRVGLFLATNFAILALVSLVLWIFGVNTSNMLGLWIYAILFGFSGSFLSLLISKKMAKWTMRLQVLDSKSLRTDAEAFIYNTVQRQALIAKIKMPEVAIWNSPEINAFATGPTKNNALVAVSDGLLRRMDKDEVEAVIAHEISHIANGDMVTMALLQGVLNTFVIVLSQVLARIIGSLLKDRDGHFSALIAIPLQLLLGMFASMIAMWFSRRREFRADAGAAKIVGSEKMISALQKLKSSFSNETMPKTLKAFGLKGDSGLGLFKKLFMSHPPLDDRIRALQK